MRIVIGGPSGSGKTTLARMLTKIVRPKPELISGDEYIKETSANLDCLHVRLGEDRYIFEHVSGPRIISRLGIKTDVLILLGPCSTYRLEDLQEWENYADVVIRGEGISEVLWPCLDQLRISGTFPPPVHSFVLKVASRCNLNCSYCYMYQGHDRSWSNEPLAMSTEVASRIGLRIREHVQAHPSRPVSVIFHGGEPLSLSIGEFLRVAEAVKAEINDLDSISYGVQTNGITLTTEYLQALDQLGFSIGISLDGGSEYANRFRVNHAGRSSYRGTVSAIQRCLSFPFKHGRFGGVLCVINPEESGREVYRFFRSLGVRSMDFLLKDTNHESPADNVTSNGRTAKNFLFEAFSEWLVDEGACDVRLFKTIIAQILDYPWGTDALGLYPLSSVGVSVSGKWEFLDLLRTSFEGAWQTPYNVFDNSVGHLQSSAEYLSLLAWQYDYSDKCLGCDNLLSCGSGYLPHRYSPTNKFKNPSIYCDDIYALIEFIRQALGEQLQSARAVL